ncbi:hypothetical protein ACLB2K_005851 [Fragaria x ananassa]
MENTAGSKKILPNHVLLQDEELHKYILETSVYPREPEPLKELREATAKLPNACFGTAPDADNYWNYHERLMKLVKIGGIVMYDNTLWGGTVAKPEEAVSESRRPWRRATIEFNKSVLADPRVEIAHASVGDGIIICRRIC